MNIITLNWAVTEAEAESVLGCGIASIEYCPEEMAERGLTHLWKVATCRRLGITIMFDDHPAVVGECQREGIHAIAVRPLSTTR